jgi:hypothetical protein
VSAFEVVPGATRIRFTLPVPADGWASFRRSTLALTLLTFGYVGGEETEHAWQVRAAADVEGARYRASFKVTVAPLTGPEEPYAPRPIVVPPSDKRAR